MTTDDDGLSPLDEALVAHLVSGNSYAQAAELLDVSVSTVSRRMAMASFRQRVETGRAEFLETAAAAVLALTPTAIDTLGEVMRNGTASARVKAAESILRHAAVLPDVAEAKRRAASGIVKAARARFEQEAWSRLLNDDPPFDLPGDDDLIA